MRTSLLFCYFLFASLSAFEQSGNSSPFLAKPYLQIGYHPSAGTLELLWHTTDTDADWIVEESNSSSGPWNATALPDYKTIKAAGMATERVYHTGFTNLNPGELFFYQLKKNNQLVFAAQAMAPKAATQSYRFVTFGDIGAETVDQKKLALQAYLAKPDFVVVPGDIVYENGLISQYKTKFWPVYNADKAGAEGAPLMRSVPFMAAVGNHDADSRDLDKHPDALAYFLFWQQPLNGPDATEGGSLTPVLKASAVNRNHFMAGAGDAYPGMTNFSYNYGNTHWLVLDSNPYADWTDKKLQAWIARDLADNAGATWRFVTFHHPGFNSSREHYEQQQMRLLSPIFEAGKVDIVFNGHVHNYQRSFPMYFQPEKNGSLLAGGKDLKTIRGRVVNGKWTLDKNYDGKKNTHPNGIIYIVTGAGGQDLYNPEQETDPDSWQKFTTKFVSTVHSLTVTEVKGNKLVVKQIDPDGKELDRFVVTK